MRIEDENNVYTGVYHSLVIGMTVSTALFAIGVILALLRPSNAPLLAAAGRTPHLIHGLLSLDPVAIMTLATIAMILTPVARVVVSIVAFAVDRDYTFVAITSFVLLAIVATVVLGALGILK
jgi:uncharacterized membrane protein